MSKIIKAQIPYGKKSIKILTNQTNSKKMLIFFHGLDGSASSAKPLFNSFEDFKIVSVEQRGHMNSEIKASRFVSKHLKDYLFIIKYYFDQGFKIWIMGESMGAAYCALLCFSPNKMLEGVFAQSIPNKIVDVLKVSRKQELKIQIMTLISFLTNINYSYIATIDYEKFSNNRTLHRLARISDKNKKRQVRETLSTWAANRRAWKYLKYKTPHVPLYYFQPTDDITTNLAKVEKIFSKKRQNLSLIKAYGAKHILMHEPAFDDISIFVRNVMEKT